MFLWRLGYLFVLIIVLEELALSLSVVNKLTFKQTYFVLPDFFCIVNLRDLQKKQMTGLGILYLLSLYRVACRLNCSPGNARFSLLSKSFPLIH